MVDLQWLKMVTAQKAQTGKWKRKENVIAILEYSRLVLCN